VSASDESPVEPDLERLRSFVAGDPRLEAVRSACGQMKAYLVGGSVRDLLLGRSPADLDVAIEGDLSLVVDRIDPGATEHPRFLTARLSLDGGQVDLAGTRSESYPTPGSLPVVEPASLDHDLARRDFTVNAIAVPLARPENLIDPFDGLTAIRDRRLSLLKSDSFEDDPIRALRGARYAARFGFEPDEEMRGALAGVDLGSVSDDRVEAELERFGGESRPELALDIARAWGLIEISEELVDLVGEAGDLLEEQPWKGFTTVSEVVDSALGSEGDLRSVPEEPPSRRIDQFELLERIRPGVIVLARVSGREWLDWWPREGMKASLAIDGDALLEAGIEAGPRIGAGLRAAFAEVLEEGPTDRDRQLATALAVARNDIPG